MNLFQLFLKYRCQSRIFQALERWQTAEEGKSWEPENPAPKLWFPELTTKSLSQIEIQDKTFDSHSARR